MERKRAVVTGATSFLGSATVNALLAQDYDVTAVVRPGSLNLERLPEDDDRLWYVPLKLKDYDKLEKYVPQGDVLFHFAWDGTTPESRNDPEIQAENVRHAYEALAAAAHMGVKRFVFAGSQAEYGVHTGPMDEETPLVPRSEYGKAKLAFGQAGLRFAGERGFDFTHLRVFSVYGAGEGTSTLVSGCIRTFLEDGDMRLSAATQTWNYLNIHDFAGLMERVAEAEKGKAHGVYNVGSLDTRVLRAFIEEMHTLCGGRGRCLYGEPADRPEGDVQLAPVITKAMETFRWKPTVPFQEGVEEMIALYR